MAIKYHYDIEQNTDEWLRLRLGIITGSNINKIVTAAGKPAKNDSMRQYAAELAAQRITGRLEENFQSYAMQLGHLQEDVARDIYSEKFAPVKQCGFVTNDDLGFTVGCSPDGLVGDDGLIEIKSRMAKFQISTIVEGEMDKSFINQVQGNALIADRAYAEFIQYSSGLPIFVKRIDIDPIRREMIIDAMMAFEAEIERIKAEFLDKAASMVQTEWINFSMDGEIEACENSNKEASTC